MLSFKDFKHAFYSLSKAKGYVFTIVLTLGITLGALVAMFNLNYQLFAKPLPYPNADRLVVFKNQQYDNGQETVGRFSPYPALVETYQNKNELFERKAILAYTDSIERSMPNSPVLKTIAVTPEYFAMLGVPMLMGRHLSESEGIGAHIPVAVISYNTWEKLFNKDPDVLNKSINVLEVNFKIVGVVAKGYMEPSLLQAGWAADVWLPFEYDDLVVEFRKNWRTSMNNMFVIGVLKPHANILAAEYQDNSYIGERFKQELKEFSSFNKSSLVASLKNLKIVILGETSRSCLSMFLGALGLLIIACANISNLMLARIANQQREIAIQVALGAQQKHIFTKILSEIALLVLGASSIAIVVTVGLLELLRKIAYEQLPRLNELHLDIATALFVFFVAVLLSLFFAYFLSRRFDTRSLNSVLQSSGKGVAFQMSTKIRQLLIGSQIAITVTLLALTMQLFWQSWQQLTQVPGLEIKDQYQIKLSRAALFSTNTKEERIAFFDAIVGLLRLNPKVESVSSVADAPIFRDKPPVRMLQKDLSDATKISAIQTLSDGVFFKIVNMTLIAGRFYTQAEIRSKAELIVVNETLAKQIDPQGQVIGRKVYMISGGEPCEVVGVVKDLHLSGVPESPRFFWSFTTDYPDILLQMKPGQKFDAEEMNQVVAEVNPRMKVFYMESIQQILDKRNAPQKVVAVVAFFLALLTLLLSTMGIYGVLSYSVQLRQFEFGIRMAIGARPYTIFLQILIDNLMPVVLGLLIGLAVELGLWLWIQQTTYTLQTSLWGWMSPVVLILLLTAATSLLSVWKIIRKPASYALRGN